MLIPVEKTNIPGKARPLLQLPTPYEFPKEADPLEHLYRAEFSRLWDTINRKRGYGWEKNPWVWVVEFRRIR